MAVALRTATTAGVTGLGEHAARAAAKLEQLLPARLRPRLTTVRVVAEAAPATVTRVPSEVFAAVAAATERHEQLRFDYRDRHDSTTRRRVEPHRLVHVSGRWCLVDLDRADWRGYRMYRITPVTPTGPGSPRGKPPEADLVAYVTRGRMAALWNYRARVIVDAPADTVAARIPTGIWTVEPIDSTTTALQAGAQTPELLAAYYLGALNLDFHIDVDHNPQLAATAATLSTRYTSPTAAPSATIDSSR